MLFKLFVGNSFFGEVIFLSLIIGFEFILSCLKLLFFSVDLLFKIRDFRLEMIDFIVFIS